MAAVASNNYAYLVTTEDGSLVAWGKVDLGGSIPSETMAAIAAAGGPSAVYTTMKAFAVVAEDGSLYSWGDPRYAGLGLDGLLPSDTAAAIAAGGGVSAIVSTSRAFTVKVEDGSLHAWGDPLYGGFLPSETAEAIAAAGGASTIDSNLNAFMVVADDGSIHGWGNEVMGCSFLATVAPSERGACSISSEKTEGLAAAGGPVAVYSGYHSFVMVAEDGSLHAWGSSRNGGAIPSATLAEIMAAGGTAAAYGIKYAWCVVAEDGSLHTWGDGRYGGTIPSATAAAVMAGGGTYAVYSNSQAFLVVAEDGSLHTWGSSNHGGFIPDTTAAAIAAGGGLLTVYANRVFVVLAKDGSLHAWPDNGSFAVQGALPAELAGDNVGSTTMVSDVYANNKAFVAVHCNAAEYPQRLYDPAYNSANLPPVSYVLFYGYGHYFGNPSLGRGAPLQLAAQPQTSQPPLAGCARKAVAVEPGHTCSDAAGAGTVACPGGTFSASRYGSGYTCSSCPNTFISTAGSASCW